MFIFPQIIPHFHLLLGHDVPFSCPTQHVYLSVTFQPTDTVAFDNSGHHDATKSSSCHDVYFPLELLPTSPAAISWCTLFIFLSFHSLFPHIPSTSWAFHSGRSWPCKSPMLSSHHIMKSILHWIISHYTCRYAMMSTFILFTEYHLPALWHCGLQQQRVSRCCRIFIILPRHITS